MALLAAAALLVGLAAIATLKDGGERGRPVAVAPIEHTAPVAHGPPPAAPVPPPVAPASPTGPASPTDPAAQNSDQVVDIENGVRVIRPRRPAADAHGLAIPVPPTR